MSTKLLICQRILKARKILKTSWHLAGSQTHIDIDYLSSLALKLRCVTPHGVCKRISLSLKTGGRVWWWGSVRSEDVLHHREACVKAQQNRESVGYVLCFKEGGRFYPWKVFELCASCKSIPSFVGRLIYMKIGCSGMHLLVSLNWGFSLLICVRLS